MHIRKEPPVADFLPWTSVRFHSEEARDRFLHLAARVSVSDIEVLPMLEECCGALVRWRPGQFLAVNDVAYSQGGRIAGVRGRGRTTSDFLS
jgi:hypothetical protein